MSTIDIYWLGQHGQSNGTKPIGVRVSRASVRCGCERGEAT